MATVPNTTESREQDPPLAELLDEVAAYNPKFDEDLIRRAFDYACEYHRGQHRKSGEPFIYHPWSVAQICAGMKLDSATIAAALMHDVVEDTAAEVDGVRSQFGDDVALLVEGVTKLSRINFASREQAQAENYRKMIVAMAQDLRVVLIKLADRLHNMRTIDALPKQKQTAKARETLEIYAPLAHRLGIHSIKWELEDLAFCTLHPRRYAEIESMVNQRRGDRERYVEEAATILHRELDETSVLAEISGRAKHFYSIYAKMAQGGKEFNEIYDLTAHARAGRLGEGLLRRDRRHPLAVEADAGAVQGLHRDAQVQHVPVTAHDGDRAAGQAARDPGADDRDAPDGRVRHRRALAVQDEGRRRRPRRRVAAVAEPADGLAERRPRPGRVHGHAARRPVLGRGLRVHPQGRGEEHAGGGDAARLRLRRAHRRRPPLCGREGERPHRPAALHA